MLILNSDILESNFQMVCEACPIFRFMCDMKRGGEMSLMCENQNPVLVCNVMPFCENKALSLQYINYSIT